MHASLVRERATLSTLVRERATLCTLLHATARQKLVAQCDGLKTVYISLFVCILFLPSTVIFLMQRYFLSTVPIV